MTAAHESSRPRTPTAAEVARLASPVLVVPLGSWEQHGPHLPLDTDTRIADELATRLADRVAGTVCGPSMSVSSSGEHAGFPGTLSVGGQVVTDMLIELVRSADWAVGVVIVNGHGGNVEYLAQVRTRLGSEGRSVLVWSPHLVDPRDSHAGYVETSVMLAIDPDCVRIDEMHSGPTPLLTDVLEDMRRGGVKAVSASGVLGDPSRADPELGRRLLSAWEEDLVDAVTRWLTTRSEE